MELVLNRFRLGDRATIGEMIVGAVRFYTLEDKVREVPGVPVKEWKVYGETAIPAGRYQVIIDFSNRFKRELPHILDVPGFQGIRIHAGNTHEDTEGCILVGKSWKGEAVLNSRVALNELLNLMNEAYDRNEKILITIQEVAA